MILFLSADFSLYYPVKFALTRRNSFQNFQSPNPPKNLQKCLISQEATIYFIKYINDQIRSKLLDRKRIQVQNFKFPQNFHY